MTKRKKVQPINLVICLLSIFLIGVVTYLAVAMAGYVNLVEPIDADTAAPFQSQTSTVDGSEPTEESLQESTVSQPTASTAESSPVAISPAERKTVDFVLDLPAGRDLRILQLNDLQPTYLEAGEVTRHGFSGPFGATMAQCVWPYVTEAINAAQPDLIILGGDNVEGGFDDNGKEWEELCNVMDSYKIPWMILFGNHDRESNAGTTWQKAMLDQSEYCLFASADCTGDSNYTVALRQGGEYKYILWALDTNGTNAAMLNGNPQDDLICTQSGLQADQLQWIKSTASEIESTLGNQIPSLMFMHIPPACVFSALNQYYPDYMETPFTPANNGDFGIATETPTGGGGVGLDIIATEIGCKGMFFAHQHQVAISIAYDGIRYTWGLKSSTSSYHTPDMVGSTLITIDHQTNDFSVKYLFSDLI